MGCQRRIAGDGCYQQAFRGNIRISEEEEWAPKREEEDEVEQGTEEWTSPSDACADTWGGSGDRVTRKRDESRGQQYG